MALLRVREEVPPDPEETSQPVDAAVTVLAPLLLQELPERGLGCLSLSMPVVSYSGLIQNLIHFLSVHVRFPRGTWGLGHSGFLAEAHRCSTNSGILKNVSRL